MITDRELELQHLSERDLVQSFQEGDLSAYASIHDRYSERAARVCRRMLGDPHDAEEATQETFLRVYQALPRFNGRYQLGAWISRIATNVCLDHIRARQRRPVDATPAEELDFEDTEFEGDPETAALKGAEGRHVRKVLASLPPLHRAAIVLRDLEGFSYEEVAQILEITECQTKALIHRARCNFRKSWTPLDAVRMLIPVRFFDRFRKVEPGTEHATHVARAAQPLAEASSGLSHAASSCSMLLQQCGQIVGERFATVATTLVVGTATVGVVASGGDVSRPSLAERQVVSRSAEDQQEPASEAPASKRPTGKSRPAAVPSPQPVKESSLVPLPPAQSPTPSATPTAPPQAQASPQPSQPSSGSGGGATSAKPGATASPSPFQAAVGWEHGSGIAQVAPSSHSFSLHCETAAFEQHMEIMFADGDRSHPGRTSLYVNKGWGRLSFSVIVDGQSYNYSSWGSAPAATWDMAQARGALEIAGSYGAVAGYQPGNANLPESGSFTAKLSVDCTGSRVVAQSLVLTTQ